MPNEKYYIDRAPIMRFIVDGLNERDPMKNLGYDGIRILTELEFAPRADVEPVVHGHWIKINPKKDVEGWIEYDYKCSVCDEISREEHNYCPHCGAKMWVKVGAEEQNV